MRGALRLPRLARLLPLRRVERVVQRVPLLFGRKPHVRLVRQGRRLLAHNASLTAGFQELPQALAQLDGMTSWDADVLQVGILDL